MRELYIEDPDTGKIRLTKTAHARYATRFARAGFNIGNIKTKTEFQTAVDAMIERELHELSDTERGQNPDLDAILEGLPGWD